MHYKRKILTFGLALMLAMASGSVLAKVKIGFIATLSGGAAALGQDMLDGFKLALAERDGKLGGQEIKLIVADDQRKPAVAIQEVQEFILKDNVDLITGVTFSNIMMAIAEPLDEANIVFVGSNAGPAPLAGKKCNRHFFFASWQNDQQAEVMGQYATNQGYDEMWVIVPNYQSGWDQAAGFKRYYDGKVTNVVYTQLGQKDFSAELLSLSAANPDAIFVFEPGGMGINFIKQYNQFGLMNKIPLLTVSTVDRSTLPALGKAALGAIAGTFWGPDFDNPVSQNFVSAFKKKYGRLPSQYAAQAYDSALLIASALKKTGGDTDGKAFRKALRAADYKSLRGDYKFNVNGFPIQDFYAFKVVKNGKGGIPGNDGVYLKTIAKPLKNNEDSYASKCEY